MATSRGKATTKLTSEALAFLTERHLAMLTTLRSDNSPHVVAVGFTFDPKTHIARVITNGGSQKAVNAHERGIAVLSQVDLSGAQLAKSKLVKTDLRGSDLSALDPRTCETTGAMIDPDQAIVIARAIGFALG